MYYWNDLQVSVYIQVTWTLSRLPKIETKTLWSLGPLLGPFMSPSVLDPNFYSQKGEEVLHAAYLFADHFAYFQHRFAY